RLALGLCSPVKSGCQPAPVHRATLMRWFAKSRWMRNRSSPASNSSSPAKRGGPCQLRQRPCPNLSGSVVAGRPKSTAASPANRVDLPASLGATSTLRPGPSSRQTVPASRPTPWSTRRDQRTAVTGLAAMGLVPPATVPSQLLSLQGGQSIAQGLVQELPLGWVGRLGQGGPDAADKLSPHRRLLGPGIDHALVQRGGIVDDLQMEETGREARLPLGHRQAVRRRAGKPDLDDRFRI